jgi:ABC-type bacteriocin/lantibiotic exporter with double-glycine peptidase domain
MMFARMSRIPVIALCACALAHAAAPADVWLDVPFVKQEKNGCGAAVIAMVMQYWQQHHGQQPDPSSDAAHIQQVLYSRPAHGVYASAMEAFFRQHGYRTFAFKGEWQDLEQHLKKGRPLIAALKPGSHLPLHYVVVAGLDPEHHLVLLNDPAQRKLLNQDRSRFEQEWNAAARWTLLAVPKTDQ